MNTVTLPRHRLRNLCEIIDTYQSKMWPLCADSAGTEDTHQLIQPAWNTEQMCHSTIVIVHSDQNDNTKVNKLESLLQQLPRDKIVHMMVNMFDCIVIFSTWTETRWMTWTAKDTNEPIISKFTQILIFISKLTLPPLGMSVWPVRVRIVSLVQVQLRQKHYARKVFT